MEKWLCVPSSWCKACGIAVTTLDSDSWMPAFPILKEEDFGKSGRMYTVQSNRGNWTVWDARGTHEVYYNSDAVETVQ